ARPPTRSIVSSHKLPQIVIERPHSDPARARGAPGVPLQGAARQGRERLAERALVLLQPHHTPGDVTRMSGRRPDREPGPENRGASEDRPPHEWYSLQHLCHCASLVRVAMSVQARILRT